MNRVVCETTRECAAPCSGRGLYAYHALAQLVVCRSSLSALTCRRCGVVMESDRHPIKLTGTLGGGLRLLQAQHVVEPLCFCWLAPVWHSPSTLAEHIKGIHE